MKYMLLIYVEPTNQQPSEADQAQMMADYYAFQEQHKSQILGGEALHPTTSATTVRVRNGQNLTTDGPFAETKEILGGYYEVEVKDLDEAIAVASHIPGAKNGSVEIRPIVDFG